MFDLMTHSAHFYLWLYGVGKLLKMHSTHLVILVSEVFFVFFLHKPPVVH